METAAQKIKRIIADTLGAEQHLLTYDTDLKRDLGADSLDILEVINVLENEFQVSMSIERIERVKRVGDLITYFEKTKPLPHYTQTHQAA